MTGEKICTICGQYFRGGGHSPVPVVYTGHCCDTCYREKILPAKESEGFCEEVKATLPMIGIFQAGLTPTGTTDIHGNYCEYQWVERNEEVYARDWRGDVIGYVMDLDGYGDEFIILDNPVTIHYDHQAAVVIGDLNGRPLWTFWPEVVYYELDEDDIC